MAKRLRVIERSRSEDDTALSMLRLRMTGLSYPAIAAALGLNTHQVRDQIKGIEIDDRATCDPRASAADYEVFYR